MKHQLSNGTLEVAVLPLEGARIDSLLDVGTGKEWLYRCGSPRDPDSPRILDAGACFDEQWRGGWEEMFPNDAATIFRGRALSDHGELWRQPWEVLEADARLIRMRLRCSTVPAEVEKEVRLAPSGAELSVVHRIRNLDRVSLAFHLKHHPALAIEPGDEIVMPRAVMEPVDLSFSTILGRKTESDFPWGVGKDGRLVSLAQIPGRAADAQEFVYLSCLSDGRAGLRNRRTGTTLTLHFDRAEFPYVWLFQSYGRWREHFVAMLEPCTNVPWDLAEAYSRGTCAELEPEGTREYRVTARISRD